MRHFQFSRIKNTNFPERLRGFRAFTLIELLIVITIVAVLMALLLPSVSRALAGGQRAKCTSQLRQVGSALQSYLGDNNMMLPASWASLPCNPRVHGPSNFKSLGGHLAPYLIENAPETGAVFIPQLQCPAWPVQITAEEALKDTGTWHNTYRLVLGALGKPNPFGGAAGSQRFSVIALPDVFELPPTKIPIIYNLDRELPFWGNDPVTPEKPVFGRGRNVLYLDGHVGFEVGLDFLAGKFR